MGHGLGERTLFTTTIGRSIQVIANGQGLRWKTGGTTFDWASVTAVGADTSTFYTGDVVAGGVVTFIDGVKVPTGDKVLRFGTVIVEKTDGSGKYEIATDTSTLVKGKTFVINETILESDRMSNYIGALDAGKVFRARLLIGGTGQPSVVNFNAAMPGILFAENTAHAEIVG